MTGNVHPTTEATLADAGLVYCSDAGPGMRRRRRRAGFAYVDDAGRPVRDATTLERIAGLAIPPAWTDVWICPDPAGHLQATPAQRSRPQPVPARR